MHFTNEKQKLEKVKIKIIIIIKNSKQEKLFKR